MLSITALRRWIFWIRLIALCGVGLHRVGAVQPAARPPIFAAGSGIAVRQRALRAASGSRLLSIKRSRLSDRRQSPVDSFFRPATSARRANAYDPACARLPPGMTTQSIVRQ